MRVDQAFNKAGFEIIEAKKDSNVVTFMVRVPLQNSIVPLRWKMMMEQILPLAEDVGTKQKVKWEIDISKRFYAKNGSVRYIWRVRMGGDLASCQLALVQATLNALRSGNEVTSVPLVGQISLKPDPANGKYKGAYPRTEDDRASSVVASAFAVGSG